ncbi:MAG: hypothetical protein ACYDA1_06260 [Vulcanimicrobiaceae bacterium]
MTALTFAPHGKVLSTILIMAIYLPLLTFNGTIAIASPAPTCRAIIDAPMTTSGGTPVTFSDKTAVPKGAKLASRAWFFGDGSSVSGLNAGIQVHHTFPTPAPTMTKRYVVRLLLSYSNGAECSTTKAILVLNEQHLKGFTKLDLRGSSLTISDTEPVPNCGQFDATMHWQPGFGIEQIGANGLPIFFLFGTANMKSKGVEESTPLPITIFFTGPVSAVASAARYGIAKLNATEHTMSCSKKIEKTGFYQVSLLMLPSSSVVFKSGATKLKCKAATATTKASCAIDPSKALYITGSLSTDNEIIRKLALKIHFPKKTCSYIGPTHLLPTEIERARWYKC